MNSTRLSPYATKPSTIAAAVAPSDGQLRAEQEREDEVRRTGDARP